MTDNIQLQEYAYISGNPDHHHAYITAPLLSCLRQYVPFRGQPPHVLDLGCGNGSFSQLIASHGYKVTGIDASSSGIRFAIEHHSDCQFIQSSVYELPYNDLEHQFDVVVSIEVIEHLLYPRELIRAAKRCLKPGGRLILTTPYHGYWKNLMMALTGRLDQHFTALWDGGHVKFFSAKTLRQLMEEEGLSQIQFNFAGRYPYFWKSMICTGVML